MGRAVQMGCEQCGMGQPDINFDELLGPITAPDAPTCVPGIDPGCQGPLESTGPQSSVFTVTSTAQANSFPWWIVAVVGGVLILNNGSGSRKR